MEVRDITVREGLPNLMDIALYTVWISPGNPAIPDRQTCIYLYDPTGAQAGGTLPGSVLFNLSHGPEILLDDFLTF